MSATSGSATTAARVLIAGGGFAALETALALRAVAGGRAALTLISPSATFVYRPAATAEAFSEVPPRLYDLRKIASDLGATFHASPLDTVHPQQQTVSLESGADLAYDSLVIAIGARPVVGVSGAFTFRDQRDVPRLTALLDELASGALRRLVFAVPSSHCWSLPAYELALLFSQHAKRHSAPTEISIVTPEDEPLEVFGAQASRAVENLLSERRIRFVGNSIPHSVREDGSLVIQFAAPVRADRVVAVPELQAVRITGLPGSWSGFIPTDAWGCVEGIGQVYAAGDITTFPVKQAGLAAQQADAVAQRIAAGLGTPVKESGNRRILRARLLTGDGALVLRTELDALGHPTAAGVQYREWRPVEDLKVFGRYLTPYLSLHGARLRLMGPQPEVVL
ncbi:MAG: NAD(P)/FAD-dependent oxidoreductase [Candidatus Woesearchaeota archaeon]